MSPFSKTERNGRRATISAERTGVPAGRYSRPRNSTITPQRLPSRYGETSREIEEQPRNNRGTTEEQPRNNRGHLQSNTRASRLHPVCNRLADGLPHPVFPVFLSAPARWFGDMFPAARA